MAPVASYYNHYPSYTLPVLDNVQDQEEDQPQFEPLRVSRHRTMRSRLEAITSINLAAFNYHHLSLVQPRSRTTTTTSIAFSNPIFLSELYD
jgi:hypothetical protein